MRVYVDETIADKCPGMHAGQSRRRRPDGMTSQCLTVNVMYLDMSGIHNDGM